MGALYIQKISIYFVRSSVNLIWLTRMSVSCFSINTEIVCALLHLKSKISLLLCYNNAVMLCHLSRHIWPPWAYHSLAFVSCIRGLTGQTQCTVALLIRCLWFPFCCCNTESYRLKRKSASIRLSSLLNLAATSHLTVLVISNTDCDHINPLQAQLLTDSFLY